MSRIIWIIIIGFIVSLLVPAVNPFSEIMIKPQKLAKKVRKTDAGNTGKRKAAGECQPLKAVVEKNGGCNGIYYAACSLQGFMTGLNC